MANSRTNPKKGAKQQEARRIALIIFKPADILVLFKEGGVFRENFKVIKGLPDDAVLEHLFFDNQREGWCMIVRSESFEPVEFGLMPPTLPVRIEVS